MKHKYFRQFLLQKMFFFFVYLYYSDYYFLIFRLYFCETNISMGLFNRILGNKLKVEEESFVNWIPLNSLDQIMLS